MRYNFAVMAWGEHQVNNYLKVALPSHLYPGNISNFPWLNDSLYEIYTTRADALVIKEDPNYPKLCQLISVEFVFIDDHIGDSKWATIRECHRQQVNWANDRDDALFFLCADQLWSAFSFSNAAHWIELGRSAVVCAGPRAQLEHVIDVPSSVETLTGRDLVRMLCANPHRETSDWCWDSNNYFQYGTYIYFSVPGEGLLAFCYIMHPVVVKPTVKRAPFHRVFDQDWLANACPDPKSVHVVTDSDEVCQIELSPRAMELPSQPDNLHMDPIEALAWYAEPTYNKHHRYFATHPIRLHYTPMTEEVWEAQIQRGVAVIEGATAWLNVSDEELLQLRPEHLMRRVNFRARYRTPTAEELALLRRAQAALELRRRRAPWKANP